MRHFLDFERPIAELDSKIEELRHLSTTGDLNIADEVGRLQIKADRLLRQTYAHLTPWQKVQVARHPERPHARDYICGLLSDLCRWQAIALLPKIRPSSAGSAASAAAAWSFSAPKRAAIRKGGSDIISAWPGPRGIARRVG